jgi:GMP synthase-like glutamine amidotransferase
METQGVKEIEPRGKILFINMGPTSDKPSFQIASGMFGTEDKKLEAFSQMMLTKISSPALLEGESSGSFRQIKESSLFLPRVDEVNGIIITGSSFSVPLLTRDLTKFGVNREGKAVFLPIWQKELADFIKEANRKQKPLLGICFGAEMLAEALGGKVVQMGKGPDGKNLKEVGYSQIYKVSGADDPLTSGVPEEFIGIANHNREIVKVPEGAEVLAKSKFGVQIFRIGKMWGLQFHPEKTAKDTTILLERSENKGKYNPNEQKILAKMFSEETGKRILSNFLKLAWSGTQ